MTLHIKQSVGSAAHNKPLDVAVIQCLLKSHFTKIIPVKGRSCMTQSPSMRVDGECSPELICLIKEFQAEINGTKNPDGRVDVNGGTFRKLAPSPKYTGSTAKTLLFGPSPANTGFLPKVNAKQFRKLFGRQLGLTVTKGEDLLGFFGFLQNDKNIDPFAGPPTCLPRPTLKQVDHSCRWKKMVKAPGGLTVK